MTKIVFKGLTRSEMAEEVVLGRIEEAIERFPDLTSHKITVTLFMENSPIQAGPDVFGIKIQIHGRKFKSLLMVKTADNLYRAIGELVDGLLERLNRATDKSRVLKRSQARRARAQLPRAG